MTLQPIPSLHMRKISFSFLSVFSSGFMKRLFFFSTIGGGLPARLRPPAPDAREPHDLAEAAPGRGRRLHRAARPPVRRASRARPRTGEKRGRARQFGAGLVGLGGAARPSHPRHRVDGVRASGSDEARRGTYLYLYTDKKEKQIFLIYKEIQSGAFAKSYMRKGLLIYEEMRKYFPIYEEAVSHIWLCNWSILNFLIYEENLIFFFYQCIGIPIAPSRRMLETLFAGRGHPSPHVFSFSTVLQIFNAVLCNFLGCFSSDFFPLHPTIKNKIKFSLYIRKFRMEQLQSHIWGRAS